MTDLSSPTSPSGRRAGTVLDTLRLKIDPAAFDVAVFTLESVAADLGYGDVRALPGAVAWIDQLRGEGKRIMLAFAGDSAPAALDIAGIADRFDHLAHGPATAATLREALGKLGLDPRRAVVVDVDTTGIAAARELDAAYAIAVARGGATPEQLRRSGASTVVADLHELVG